MDEKSNDSKQEQEKSVFVLVEDYKDYGDDIVGVFDSMQDLCKGFADHIAADYIFSKPPSLVDNKEAKDAIYAVARKLAELIPELLAVEGNFDWTDDECYDNKTVYHYRKEPVQKFNKEIENRKEY